MRALKVTTKNNMIYLIVLSGLTDNDFRTKSDRMGRKNVYLLIEKGLLILIL